MTFSSLFMRSLTAKAPGKHRSRQQHPSFSAPHSAQMQAAYGNQAAGQRENGQSNQQAGGWFSNFLPSFPAGFTQDLFMQSAREGVSAGFGSDSVDIYDMWQLRNDPEKLNQFMQDRIHRMDGGLQ